MNMPRDLVSLSEEQVRINPPKHLDCEHFLILLQLCDFVHRAVVVMIAAAKNKLKPATRLPPEILTKVFEDCSLERDLIAAARVCKQWRATLISAPHLWTQIIDFGNYAQLRFYLDSCKKAPIDVTIRKSRGMPSAGQTDVLVGDTSWLAKAKSLRIQAHKEKFREVVNHGQLCKTLPLLESLEIIGDDSPRCTNRGGAIPFPPNFLGRHAPSLRTLVFYLVSPNVVFTFPLPNLTHISWVAEEAHVQIKELLNLLKSSPLLEDITMHVLVRGQLDTPLETVTLNELRRLDWADCAGSISLAPCLIAPKLYSLEIGVTRNPQSQGPETTLHSLLSPSLDYTPLLLKPKVVVYTSGRNTRLFSCLTSSNICLRVKEKGSFTNSWSLENLPISFSRTHVLEVELDGNFGLPPLSGFPIGEFKNLSQLLLRGKVDLLAHLIRRKPVPCTKLSKIFIHPEGPKSTVSNLLEVLQERMDAGHRVKTVEVVALSVLKDTELEKLKRVVDEVIAHC